MSAQIEVDWQVVYQGTRAVYLLPMRTLTRPAHLVALEAEHVHVFPVVGDETELESVSESEEPSEVVQRGCKRPR